MLHPVPKGQAGESPVFKAAKTTCKSPHYFTNEMYIIMGQMMKTHRNSWQKRAIVFVSQGNLTAS